MFRQLMTPLVGYKAVRTANGLQAIATLEIPARAIVHDGTASFSSEPRKHRASAARVTMVETLEFSPRPGCGCTLCSRGFISGSHPLDEARSLHDMNFVYKVGATVEPTEPFSFMNDECAAGIHFFLTREEAEDYAK